MVALYNFVHQTRYAMKSLPLLATLVLVPAVLTVSCTKEDRERLNLEAELNMQYSEIPFTVDSGIPAGPISLTLSFNANELDAVLADNGYTLDQLREFKLTGAQVQRADTQVFVYDALDRFYLDLGQDASAFQMIAQLDPVADGLTELNLDVSETDLAGVLRSDSVQLRARLELSEPVTQTTAHLLKLTGKLVVEVTQ